MSFPLFIASFELTAATSKFLDLDLKLQVQQQLPHDLEDVYDQLAGEQLQSGLNKHVTPLSLRSSLAPQVLPKTNFKEQPSASPTHINVEKQSRARDADVNIGKTATNMPTFSSNSIFESSSIASGSPSC